VGHGRETTVGRKTVGLETEGRETETEGRKTVGRGTNTGRQIGQHRVLKGIWTRARIQTIQSASLFMPGERETEKQHFLQSQAMHRGCSKISASCIKN
jgi:hypothetical protein